MLIDEKGIGLLERLLLSSGDDTVEGICTQILAIVEQDSAPSCHDKQMPHQQQVIV